jgi:hypothetical protein
MGFMDENSPGRALYCGGRGYRDVGHSGAGRNPVKKMMCEAHDIKILSASHSVFDLDSGLRRNDDSL